LKAWLDTEKSKQEKFDADKKAISDAVASIGNSKLNIIVQQLHR